MVQQTLQHPDHGQAFNWAFLPLSGIKHLTPPPSPLQKAIIARATRRRSRLRRKKRLCTSKLTPPPSAWRRLSPLADCGWGVIRLKGDLYLVLALVRIRRHPSSPFIWMEGLGVAANYRSRIFSNLRYCRGSPLGTWPADKERQRPTTQGGKVATIISPLRPLWLRGCHQGDP